MAHWKSMFTSEKYLTSADLYDFNTDTFRELTATISKVVPVTLVGKKGKKDGRPGVYFKESKSGKPLGVNATNAKAISNVAGSTDWKKWVGVRITMRVEMNDVQGEGVMPTIRVVPFAPEQQRAALGDNDARKFTPEEVAAARASIASDTAGVVGAEEIALATNPHDKNKIDADEAREIADRERKENR